MDAGDPRETDGDADSGKENVSGGKFDDHPLAKRYAEEVEKRRAEFNWEAEVATLVEKWEKEVADKRAKGVAEDKVIPPNS